MKNDVEIVDHDIEDDADVEAASGVRRKASDLEEAGVVEALLEGVEGGVEAFDVSDLKHEAFVSREVGHFGGLLGIFGDGFLDQHVFARSKEFHDDLVMEIRGGGDGDGVAGSDEVVQRGGHFAAVFANGFFWDSSALSNSP
jgi:hypothetical protein